MCGIAGQINLKLKSINNLTSRLEVMNKLQAHRGPDGKGKWLDKKNRVGFAHRRLSIIDLDTGNQPMKSESGNVITYNGEIYNYIELRNEIGKNKFRTNSDTEVILKAYEKWGVNCLNRLRGMFSFAIWDEKNKQLFCARDRFGIKPFYYTKINNIFIFASETKALLPFLETIRTNQAALKDYFVFQFTLGEKTLFDNIYKLLPAHYLLIKNGDIIDKKYWQVNYDLDWTHSKKYFQNKTRGLLKESVSLHLRSDVPVGSYLSGGIDSSIIAILARKQQSKEKYNAFTGKFSFSNEYDESKYAQIVAEKYNLRLHQKNITSKDFIENIRKVIYHLDYPIAGPGSFPQYMVSELASKHNKVVLGGQGGDEVFGGYTRYLLAYFEQCIKGAIEGTINNGKYIVTYESIISNLKSLKRYKPLMQEFWSKGLFENRDKRYFKLINRAVNLEQVVNWDLLEPYSSLEKFKEIYWGKNIENESYFDNMTFFDFKTLLPALLHVEDRMSMAHGLEARVPILDHPLIELAATIPSNIKFENGSLKHLLKSAFSNILPKGILKREDKMGFPVPLTQWLKTDLKIFINDIFKSQKAKKREYLNPKFNIESLINTEGKFDRNLWGLLSLELWQQEFHDKSQSFRKMVK